MNAAARRRRIAVLGGGCGSLAAVCELTAAPDWKQRFDITVFQMGWRLGGKGASGRNLQPKRGSRIEEHGLHVWGGFYHEAFSLMQDVYRDLQRRGLRRDGAPLSRLFGRPEDPPSATGVPTAAFWPQHQVVLMDSVPVWKDTHWEHEWVPWCIDFPADPFDWLPQQPVERLPGVASQALRSGIEHVQILSTFFYQSVRRISSDSFEFPSSVEHVALPRWVHDDRDLLARLEAWRAPPPPAQPSPRPLDAPMAVQRLIQSHREGVDETLKKFDDRSTYEAKAEGPPFDPEQFVRLHFEQMRSALVPFAPFLHPGLDPVEAARGVLQEHARHLTLSVALAHVVHEDDLRRAAATRDRADLSTPLLDLLAEQTRAVQEFQTALMRSEKLHALLEAASPEMLMHTAYSRRRHFVLDLAAAIVRGIIRDGLWLLPFESIDHLEFRAWLARHGATSLTLESSVVMAAYDYTFAYQDGFIGDEQMLGTAPRGSTERAQLAAGTALKGTLDLLFGYRGAIFWEMQAGMGDAVFAPIYQLLHDRGVKFRFFHRVDALRLSPDRRVVDRIEILEQMQVKGGGEYAPLVEVKGLPCWPSAPLYAQLVHGSEELQPGFENAAGGTAPALDHDPDFDLESIWNLWDRGNATPRTLRRGHDFDDVLLGISIGDFPYLCRELIAANARWRAMVERIGTVPTCAMQLWLTASTEDLGWPWPGAEAAGSPGAAPILTGFSHRLNTWADLSHLGPRAENWPQNGPGVPRSVAYFCGPFSDRCVALGREDPDAHREAIGVQREVLEKVQKHGLQWVKHHAATLWRNLGDEQDLFRALLVPGPGPAAGEDALLEHQYFRANVNPSDLYVQSLPGTTALRIAAGDSGFDNLFLAGDWVRTDLNAGCVECAVMAGLDAADAIDDAIPANPLHALAFLAGSVSAAAGVVGEGLLRGLRRARPPDP